MADFDVEVRGLTTPPPDAVTTTYRPAVSVRNNGIHNALAQGILRIYRDDRLVFSTELYSDTIAPGKTSQAQAVDYWTPTEGKYLITADVTCDSDQVESNNHLAPTRVTVKKGEAPQPTPVPLHAAQHEDGALDELIVDGLHGKLSDAQDPTSHKASHQAGGSDELSVDGLPGILRDGQPIADHHQTHENDGTDELNVDDLHGVLYNKQKPQTHGNEAHDPNFAPTPHGNEAHNPDFAHLVHAEQHQSGGEDVINLAGLSGLAADHQGPGVESRPTPPPIGLSGGEVGIIVDHTFPAHQVSSLDTIELDAFLLYYDTLQSTPSITVSIKSGSSNFVQALSFSIPLPAPTEDIMAIHVRAWLSPYGSLIGCTGYADLSRPCANPLRSWDSTSAIEWDPDKYLRVKAEYTIPVSISAGGSIKQSYLRRSRVLSYS